MTKIYQIIKCKMITYYIKLYYNCFWAAHIPIKQSSWTEGTLKRICRHRCFDPHDTFCALYKRESERTP